MYLYTYHSINSHLVYGLHFYFDVSNPPCILVCLYYFFSCSLQANVFIGEVHNHIGGISIPSCLSCLLDITFQVRWWSPLYDSMHGQSRPIPNATVDITILNLLLGFTNDFIIHSFYFRCSARSEHVSISKS